MNILLSIIFLIGGLILLIKGSDIFVDAGTAIGKIFKMSEVLIGLTIVCVGTGLPELVLSLTSSIVGNSSLVIGNIIGSNIFNMCCILGLICILNPLKLLKETVRKDINMSLLSSVAVFVLLLDTVVNKNNVSMLSRTDGIILLLFFSVFLYYTFYEFAGYLRDKRERKYKEQQERKANGEKIENKKKSEKIFTMEDMQNVAKQALIAIIGIILVHLGAQLTINSVEKIALHFNVSQSFISILVIAVGTSLPELTTSIVALKKKHIHIAIGNLIGSNMFNSLLVLGAASLARPVVLEGTYLLIDAAVFILVCLVMRIFVRKKPELSKLEGFILLFIYIVYMMYVIYRR